MAMMPILLHYFHSFSGTAMLQAKAVARCGKAAIATHIEAIHTFTLLLETRPVLPQGKKMCYWVSCSKRVLAMFDWLKNGDPTFSLSRRHSVTKRVLVCEPVTPLNKRLSYSQQKPTIFLTAQVYVRAGYVQCSTSVSLRRVGSGYRG